MQLPHEVVQYQKRLADEFEGINRVATPQSLQLPVTVCSVNFKMDHNDLDYNNMD